MEVQRGEVVEKQAVILGVGGLERDELQDVRGLRLDHDTLRLDFGGKLGKRRIDPVLHEHLGRVGAGADLERDGECIVAVVRRARLHVKHAGDTVDLELDRQRDLVDDGLRACSREVGCDDNGGRSDRRELADRQNHEGDPAQKHHHESDDVGKDRPLDEELRKHPVSGGRRR